METDFSNTHLNQLDKSQLIEIIISLKKELDKLSKEINKPDKNSKNSSKPPSSDFKSDTAEVKKNKGGAKKGHKGHKRNLKEADKTVYIDIDDCPNCGFKHSYNSTIYTNHQILELEKLDIKVIDIKRQKSICAIGDKTILASNPPGVFDNDVFGPNLKCLILMLYYDSRMPYDKIKDLINTFSSVKVSKASIINVVKKCGNIFKKYYDKIQSNIRTGKIVGIDETGWRVDGEKFWLWVFQNEDNVLYSIEKHRNSDVVESILGEYYSGVVLSDFYSAYIKVKSKYKQKCLAHLLRTLEFIHECVGKKDYSYAFRLMELFRKAIHLKNSEDLNSPKYKLECKLIEANLDILISKKVSDKEELKMSKRLKKYREELLLFLKLEYVSPTNNRSELSIRSRVIHRKICNGNKSISGKDAYSVNASVIETLKRRKENLFDGIVGLFEKYSKKEPNLRFKFRKIDFAFT